MIADPRRPRRPADAATPWRKSALDPSLAPDYDSLHLGECSCRSHARSLFSIVTLAALAACAPESSDRDQQPHRTRCQPPQPIGSDARLTDATFPSLSRLRSRARRRGDCHAWIRVAETDEPFATAGPRADTARAISSRHTGSPAPRRRMAQARRSRSSMHTTIRMPRAISRFIAARSDCPRARRRTDASAR